MTSRVKVSFYCHLFATVLSITFGLVYMVSKEFMPYHAEVVRMQWADLDPAIRVLFHSSMKLIGGTWLANGVAMGVLLIIPFRKGLKWAYWAVPIIGLIAAATALYATIYVAQNTLATPPWIFPAVGIGLLIMGFLLSLGAFNETDVAKK
jgi:hypothetical protein